jgi:hypothetical protein
MRGRVTYREEVAVSSVNEVEGSIGKPGAGGNVMNLEVNVLWWGPRGNRSWIRDSKRTTGAWSVTLHSPISSALNLT